MSGTYIRGQLFVWILYFTFDDTYEILPYYLNTFKYVIYMCWEYLIICFLLHLKQALWSCMIYMFVAHLLWSKRVPAYICHTRVL